jgi:hypothetical protein
MIMKSLDLFTVVTLLASLVSSSSNACRVTIDGIDRTEELMVFDVDLSGPSSYVNCEGIKRCHSGIIENCPVVKCAGKEACFQAKIINATKSMTCDGAYACHRTDMRLLDNAEEKPSVTCKGATSCEYATMEGAMKHVSCWGGKACRRAVIKGAEVVKCHNGVENNPACFHLATFETQCLYCGVQGCDVHKNQCRVKLLGEDGEPIADKYEKCTVENIMGNCPEVLREELKLELSQQVNGSVEGGVRKFLRL